MAILAARTLTYLFLGLILAEFFIRSAWRFGVLDFDLEMWRYANTIKTVSNDPQIGLEQIPNAEEHLMGVRVRTDEFGFRRSDDATEALRSQKGPVILVIGDSATLGWGVPEGETYAARLQQALPEYRIYNSGIGNTNTSMQVHLLKANLKKIKPDWVVLGYTINDPEPNPDLRRGFDITHVALGFALKKLSQLIFAGNSLSYIDYYKSLYAEGSQTWSAWKSSAGAFAELTKEHSIPSTVLLIPEFHFPFQQGPFREVYLRVAQHFANLGIEVVDPSEDFAPGDGSSYWVVPSDPHPNSKAHDILARALLKSRNLRDRK